MKNLSIAISILLNILTYVAIVLCWLLFGTKDNAILFILISFLSGYWGSLIISIVSNENKSKTNND